ncbi:MAG: hypothetical protein IPI42_07750 [Saprospiraceae bacterium]|nr:hypothetical protein [Candidatus Parvibacillus calidus]
MTKNIPSPSRKEVEYTELKIIVNRELKISMANHTLLRLDKKLKISNNRDEVQLILEKLVKEGRVRQTTGGVYQGKTNHPFLKNFLLESGFDSFWSRLYSSRRKIR